MTNFHTDNLPELTAGNYHKTANNHTVNCTSTEPHSQAEPGINMVKKHSQRAITHPWGSVGLCPFLAGQKLVSSSGVDLRNERQSLPSGIENVLGNLPNISHLLYFNIDQPVHYLEQVVAYPEDCQLLGCWLDSSHDVGQALCYWSMKRTQWHSKQRKVLGWSTIV